MDRTRKRPSAKPASRSLASASYDGTQLGDAIVQQTLLASQVSPLSLASKTDLAGDAALAEPGRVPRLAVRGRRANKIQTGGARYSRG